MKRAIRHSVHLGRAVLLVCTMLTLAGAAVSGCDHARSEQVDQEPTVASSVEQSSSPAVVSTTTPASVSARLETLKLGEKRTVGVDGYKVEVTAIQIKHGDTYEGVQVRACNRGRPVGVSSGPWMLGYSNFEELHDTDISGGGLAEPAYEDRDLETGECAKGWLNFTRIDGRNPTGVQYAPDGVQPVRWTFARR